MCGWDLRPMLLLFSEPGTLTGVTDPAAAPDDRVIVLIEDEEPTMTFEEWLTLLEGDPPTDVDAGAAEILREFREHGER